MKALTRENVSHCARFKIAVTSGYGTGVCGPLGLIGVAMPILALSDQSVMPTDEELGLLRCLLEFSIYDYYKPSYVEKLLDMQFPADEGTNTIVFVKGDHWSPNGVAGWAYRQITWSTGPLFVPSRDSKPIPPWTLEQAVLHELRFEERVGRWEAFKSKHLARCSAPGPVVELAFERRES